MSQPAISEQIRELENSLGEKLFRRDGRANKLTEIGQLVFGYAEGIFALGSELVSAVRQRQGGRTLRLNVGVADSFPKLVTNEILKPVFESEAESVHVICREGKLNDLLAQLAVHRLDLVLSDEPASSATEFTTFSHALGETGTVFCASSKLAARLRQNFPRSLDGAPALLPTENTGLRRALEQWFHDVGLQPRVVAEFEDLALMQVMAAEGRGFMAVPAMAANDAVAHHGFRIIGEAKECRVRFYGLTVERRIAHPAVALVLRADHGVKTL